MMVKTIRKVLRVLPEVTCAATSLFFTLSIMIHGWHCCYMVSHWFERYVEFPFILTMAFALLAKVIGECVSKA